MSPQDQHLELESRFPHLPDATAACSNSAGAAHHVTKGQAIKRMGTFTHSAGECALTGECAERALSNSKCKTKGSGDELCPPLTHRAAAAEPTSWAVDEPRAALIPRPPAPASHQKAVTG